MEIGARIRSGASQWQFTVNSGPPSALFRHMDLIELDGAEGEGGGQILRTSLALSLITGRPFHLRNVRAGRSQPGLRPQHLASVRAAAAISGAAMRGATAGSSDLVFEPGPVRPGNYRFDIGTAGATSLVLHTVYLPLSLCVDVPSTVTLTGGTHVRAAPTYHFLESTWRPYAELCGLKVNLRLVQPGFYPRGGGVVAAAIQPVTRLNGLRLLERASVSVTGFSAVAGLPADIARRQARRAAYRLKQQGLEPELRVEEWKGGPGSVLALEVSGGAVPALFVAIGERGKPAERVADEAADEAIAFLQAEQASVDGHSADQLVLPLALADERSEFAVASVTSHLTTNVSVIRRFLECPIAIDGAEGGPGTVRIPGSERSSLINRHALDA
jgi:RNA 3'-phosphate cyclase